VCTARSLDPDARPGQSLSAARLRYAARVRADAVVIGAGHNGLVCGAYLARAGLRVVILERREVLGGAACTEELWPGYRVSRGAYVAGLLRPQIVEELGLAARGLRLLRRSPSSFTPLPDGRGLLLGPDRAESCASIRRFSARDAARYPDYEAFIDRVARWLEPLLDAAPPDPARPRPRDLSLLGKIARGAWRLRRELPDVAALLLGPARDALEGWFASEPLLATLATDAVIGAFAPPSAPGTGYVLLHHVMGETFGERGVWAYVEGGMGRLADALASAAREAGAEIRTESAVARIRVAAGRVRGVALEDGREIDAPIAVSSADPRRTLLELAGREHLPERIARALGRLDVRSGSAKLNLALDRLPRFPGYGEGPGPEHRGTIHVGASDLDAIESAFQAAANGRIPERPIVELTLPSVLDPTLAPPGHHVASMFVQYVPHTLPDESAWSRARSELAARCMALVDEVAPGFSSSALHCEVLAPPDLERVFALPGGHIFHGAMSPDRLFFLRPLPGLAAYRTPVAGLYLCGAGTHPGGGVMGACGRNAAREILRDLRRY
jgi:phytoene dehydrogenase-like protein